MQRKLWLVLILAFLLGTGTAFAQEPEENEYPAPAARGQDQAMKHLTVKGKIERISGQEAVLRTQDGRDVTVHLGPQRFWRDKGYHLNTGAVVRVEGWGDTYGEDGGFIYAGGIYGDGFSIELMDSRGFPMWADRDEWSDDWYPSYSVFQLYFGPSWGYGPWGYWGPPPRWWHRPYWWHPRPYRHYHDRPWGPPPGPPRHAPRHGRH